MSSSDVSQVDIRTALLAAIDHLVGPHARERFIEEAVEEKLTLERQRQELDKYMGTFDLAEYPEWDTPEKISSWVRSLREEADARTEEKIRRPKP